ncbi:carbohydrate-binding module family 1 protein [Diplodia corticola]|uniref:AA9 family lytic polysaccharide monooxygenase n=1 Tax=Diplodia corticola TaxID=236234 RepID=A0A1J9QS05_9PEZI|nr:carbohydrate-binding module family 1 protein [Diplodia corticola]OJD31734.1 carbohydrate-binding module family 1 protein [Diplodia corticola]
MKTQMYGMLALAAAAKLANAHTTVFAAWINDEDQGTGNTAAGYIRSPPSNSPIKDVTSTDMTCNANNVATAKTLEVKSGDKFTFEWHHDSRTDSDDIIASSHKGPVLVYMAPTTKGASGSGWVKIAEDGYSGGTWAVDTLITNKGKHSITIPDVPAGEYLLRPEIIALHEGSTNGGAQFYMECVQVKVTSDGASTLPEGVSIPGTYTAEDAGILFDIYNSFDSYPIPGPSVWDGASGSGSTAATSSAAVKAEASSTPVASSTSVEAAAAAVSTPATTAASSPSTTPAAADNGAVTETAYTTEDVVATTFATVTAGGQAASTPATSAAAEATPATGSSSGSVQAYGQCGGSGYSGSSSCASGYTCKEWNAYYSQCVSSS